MNESQLIKAIKAQIAKGDQAKDKAEQHYISTGQHLKTLKAEHDSYGGDWAKWAALLRTKCDLSTGRASELMQIADGRSSQEKIREADAERKRLARNKKSSSGHPEEEPPPDESFLDDSGDYAPIDRDAAAATRVRGFLNRADQSARGAEVDDLAGLEITQEMRDAAMKAASAWTRICQLMEAAKPASSVVLNGNGADLWAHLSKDNAEALDRWIESDK